MISMLIKLISWFCQQFSRRARTKIIKPGFTGEVLQPLILQRSEHNFSRRSMSPYSLKVLYRLHDAGYSAYLVGGGVRDVLLGLHPKDFDIATNASPEEVTELFRNSRLIGRRFRLVHVHFGRYIVEVATFRAGPAANHVDPSLAGTRADGMIIRDNIYGTLEEDIFRRDFTINALYYNIADYSLIDYVGGMQDLKSGLIRIIGDPLQRYREDPVRMLRAIRFAAKLKFKIHADTEKPIFEQKNLISNVPAARLFDEYLKLFLSGYSKESFRLLHHYGFIAILFPSLEKLLTRPLKWNWIERFLQLAFHNTDERIREEKSVSPHFLLAALLWYPVVFEMEKLVTTGLSLNAAFHGAFEQVWQEQRSSFSVPRRLVQIVKEISSLQIRLKRRSQKTTLALYSHTRFRAAYDFLLLRAEALDPDAMELASWWTNYIAADESSRENMISALIPNKARKKRKRFHHQRIVKS